MASDISLSAQEAYELCKAHREKNGVRVFSQCWGCVRYSKEVPEKMCFYKPPTNNACKHVNEQYKTAVT